MQHVHTCSQLLSKLSTASLIYNYFFHDAFMMRLLRAQVELAERSALVMASLIHGVAVDKAESLVYPESAKRLCLRAPQLVLPE